MHASNLPFTVEEWLNLQPRLFWCYDGVVLTSDREMLSKGPQLFAWWIQRGSVTLRRGDQTWQAHAGEWMLGGIEPRYQAFSPGARILSVNFKLEWPSGDSLVNPMMVLPAAEQSALCRAGKKLAHFVGTRFPESRSNFWLQRMQLRDFMELQKLFSAWTTAYVETVLDAGHVPTRMSGTDSRVVEALRRLDRHPWTTPFSEEDLARELGISTGHLDRLFMQHQGLSPRAHLQKRRLETASALLTDAAMPIKRIAYELGFGSPSHFCHWFRKALGRSPRAFRSGKARSQSKN